MIIMMMIVEQWVSGVKNIFVLHQIRVGSGIAIMPQRCVFLLNWNSIRVHLQLEISQHILSATGFIILVVN